MSVPSTSRVTCGKRVVKEGGVNKGCLVPRVMGTKAMIAYGASL